MNLHVVHVQDEAELKLAFDIREKVYIIEQQIDREDEFDEFDSTSDHFLAYLDDEPTGTCRYRLTKGGIKLERFATLKEYRGKGVASALMERMLDHIEKYDLKQTLYLNAQITAMPLYAKFGFQPEGFVFLECDIEHQKMVRQPL
ncbi:MAG: GNAT family N-acetyltransferase [Bacteroidota bacterium]